MRWRNWTLLITLAAATTLHAQRYRLQSNPWVNLHQRLLYEAQLKDAPPVALSGDDLTKWKKAVDAYRAWVRKRSPLFDEELKGLNETLSATTGPKLPASVPKPAAAVLAAAMPLYRLAQWEQDDRANRFWIALAEPMLASAGEELAEAHAKVYGVPFPKRILVDVSALAWQFSAYTVGEGESAHAVVSSIEPKNQGFAALEVLLHEPSHAIVDADPKFAIGSDLARLTRETGIRPYANLWHALLFYTTGELTRRALAARGVQNYQPMITPMYAGPFRGFQQSLETHWQAYLDGKISREAAIRQVFMETAPAKNK